MSTYSKYLSAVIRKSEDARHQLDDLTFEEETHFLKFRSSYLSSVNAIESIYECISNFQPPSQLLIDWRNKVKNQHSSEPLLSLISKFRIDDFHHAKEILQPTKTEVKNAGVITAEGGPVTIGPDGFYRTINKDTPQERRVPVGQGVTRTEVALRKLPVNLGSHILDMDPVEVLVKAVEVYEKLIHEAKQIETST